MSSAGLNSQPTSPAIDRLGIIAGEGDFPIHIAREAKNRGIAVTAFGIRGITSPELESSVDSIHWLRPDISSFREIIELAHRYGIGHAVMAGRIRHEAVFAITQSNSADSSRIKALENKKADTVLGFFTGELERQNIRVLDQGLFLDGFKPPPGLMTPAYPPSDETRRDIDFGFDLARRIAGLDVGQSIAVKSGTVVAVEAMEGTDAMIERAGAIAGEGIVVVKVDKPNQDQRFDVPVIGLTTMKKLVKARAAALAFPAGRVLFFDQPESLALAAENRISVISIE